LEQLENKTLIYIERGKLKWNGALGHLSWQKEIRGKNWKRFIFVKEREEAKEGQSE
jgi:hypothetical protein